jgi:hypothetical protein
MAKDQDNFQTVSNDDDWNNVDAESQIVFDTHGDEFIGRYVGMDAPTPKGIVQAHFEKDGTSYFVNAGHDLRQKLAKVPARSLVRIRYTDDLNTGQQTPMRVFDVAHKR